MWGRRNVPSKTSHSNSSAVEWKDGVGCFQPIPGRRTMSLMDTLRRKDESRGGVVQPPHGYGEERRLAGGQLKTRFEGPLRWRRGPLSHRTRTRKQERMNNADKTSSGLVETGRHLPRRFLHDGRGPGSKPGAVAVGAVVRAELRRMALLAGRQPARSEAGAGLG